MIDKAFPSKIITIVVRIAKNERHITIQCNGHIGIIGNFYTESDDRVGCRRILDNIDNINDVSHVHPAVTINITVGIIRITCDNFGNFFDVGIVNNTVAIHITF